jgi:hypothetical protein
MAVSLPYRYYAYGLQIWSDRAVPGLQPTLLVHQGADLTLYFDRYPAFPTPSFANTHEVCVGSVRTDDNEPLLRVRHACDGSFYWFIHEEYEAIIDRAARTVWASWPSPYSFANTAVFIRGPVLGYVQRLRGVTCLHASAVNIEGTAVAFAGQVGAGKSTLAAEFVRRGFPLVSEDVVPLQPASDAILVQPGHPNVGLWPDSVAAAYGHEEALPRFVPGWNKRCLDVAANGSFARSVLPLGAIYLLSQRRNEDAPRIEDVQGSERLVALAENTYAGWLADAAGRARDFGVLSALIRLPIRRIVPHCDPAALSRMAELVLEDVSSAISRVRLLRV